MGAQLYFWQDSDREILLQKRFALWLDYNSGYDKLNITNLTIFCVVMLFHDVTQSSVSEIVCFTNIVL